MQTYDVLVVGAGHSGAQVAIALRQHGFKGTIALVSEEPEIPYERPPLSKDYLAGEKTFERLIIRPMSFWEERGVVLLSGCRVTAVMPEEHLISTESGEAIGYNRLVWAAGGRARRLKCPGHEIRGVHCLRNRADVDQILSELPSVSDVAVVGAGYLGLEVAAVLTKLGKKVSVFEALDRVLARVAGGPLSRFFEEEHRRHGVDIRLNALVDRIEEYAGYISAVQLADGQRVAAQMVIVAIGIEPEVDPLLKAGANVEDGVIVDEYCRTSLIDVWAIGDCASHKNPFADGRKIRLESVQNANDMASTVAHAITGELKSYKVLPWFWSNQYDLSLQTVGLSVGHDSAIVRGDPSQRSFSVIYLRGGKVIALDNVNAAKNYMQGKSLILSDAIIDVSKLADESIPLSKLI